MTPTPNKVEAPELLAVEQVDRIAAASLAPSDIVSHAGGVEILVGLQDSHPVVQAFARHRIEATRTPDERIAGLVSALEKGRKLIPAAMGEPFSTWAKDTDALLATFRETDRG